MGFRLGIPETSFQLSTSLTLAEGFLFGVRDLEIPPTAAPTHTWQHSGIIVYQSDKRDHFDKEDLREHNLPQYTKGKIFFFLQYQCWKAPPVVVFTLIFTCAQRHFTDQRGSKDVLGQVQ